MLTLLVHAGTPRPFAACSPQRGALRRGLVLHMCRHECAHLPFSVSRYNQTGPKYKFSDAIATPERKELSTQGLSLIHISEPTRPY